MAQNTIADLSVTAASNTDFLGVGILGSDLVSTADDAFRSEAAILARAYNDYGGIVTVGGTANAITITSASIYQALASGLVIRFKASNDNSGAVTLNLDGLGAKAIRKIVGGSTVALQAGDLLQNQQFVLVYSTTADGWLLQGLNLQINGANLNAVTGTNQIKFANGSASAPSYSFSTDTTKGFYGNGTNTIGVSIAGVSSATFTTTGFGPESGVSYNLGTAVAAWTNAFIASNGKIDFNSGDVTITHASASGGSLAFAGAANGYSFDAGVTLASGGSKLSYYAENVAWTPVVAFGGASVGVTYTTQTGTYSREGNVVTVTCNIVLSSKGSSTGAATITGLPFTPGAVASCAIHIGGGVYSGLTAGIYGFVASGTASVNLRMPNTTGSAAVADTNMTNTSNVIFELTYLV